ncbi:MAG: response regulator transcription factor [Herpetosiphon sp.]
MSVQGRYSDAQNRVLVIDDEPSVRAFIERNLVARGFAVTLASHGHDALAKWTEECFALVILDIMMPSMDGIEVCRRIRRTSNVPIIVLTALDDEADKIQALDQGADDYLTKPFGVGELLARIRALLRRSQWTEAGPPTEPLWLGEVEVRWDERRALHAGQEIKLTPTEFDLLRELALQPGKLWTHEALLTRVWGPDYSQETEYLRVYIARLRRKLEPDPARPRHLLTEQGIGYYLIL